MTAATRPCRAGQPSHVTRALSRVVDAGIAVIAVVLALAAPAPFQTAAAAAQAGPAHRAFPRLQLPRPVHGHDAVAALGSRLPEVAAWYRLSPERLAQLLKQDRAAWLDRDGRLFYVEEAAADHAEPVTAAALPQPPLYPYDQTFQLHSRPGASRVLYMDFDGHVVSGTAWNLGTIAAAPYDTDGDPTRFSDGERQTIQLAWQRVANDFAPFDIDVTTAEPPAQALAREGQDDTDFGTRAVITSNNFGVCLGCGGIAYVGVFDLLGDHDYYQPVWIFNKTSAKVIAETVSHEVGHNFGLHHDGTLLSPYYSGHGTGATSWGPIMGTAFSPAVTQWSKGEYPGANNHEDDLAIIAAGGAPYRSDDFPGEFAAGYSALAMLQGSDIDGTIVVDQSGFIERNTDADDLAFTAGAGAASFTVMPMSSPGVNLDAAIEIYDSSGSLVGSADDGTGPGSTASVTLAAGRYFVRVRGSGDSDPAPGYSSYASLGEYRITGSFASAGDTTPDAYSFSPRANVPRSSLQTSDAVLAGGITGMTWISVTGGSYSVNGAPFTTANGMVASGDSIRVQHTASSLNHAGVNTTLDIGGVVRIFRSVTADIVPGDFSFAPATNVARGSLLTSGAVSIAGITAPAPISISGGSYSVNGGSFTTAAGFVVSGDWVRVQHTASSLNYAGVNSTLNIGGLSRVFRSITADTIPDAFSFMPASDVARGGLQTSNAIMVSGLSAPTAISIARGSYSINGAAFTTAPGNVVNGDLVRVQRYASATAATTVSTALTIGEATRGLFSITTAP